MHHDQEKSCKKRIGSCPGRVVIGSKCNNENSKDASSDASGVSDFSSVKTVNQGVCVSKNFDTDLQYRESKYAVNNPVIMCKKYHTKCFYNSSIDKKCMLAKGNKRKQLTKKGVNVRSRVYISKNKAMVVENDHDLDKKQSGPLTKHDNTLSVNKK